MMVDLNQTIEVVEPIVEAKDIEAFRKATYSEAAGGIPLTFVTRFRRTEFEWLGRLNINLADVLHTEQEYEFFGNFTIGDELKMITRIASYRERKVGSKKMLFVAIRGELKKDDNIVVLCRSSFVVRSAQE